MKNKRLAKKDWLQAGFRALTSDGVEALKAEKLARGVGTTKGSFYWHFKDVPAFKTEMIDHWVESACHGIANEVAAHGTAAEQLVRLMSLAAHDPKEYGGRGAEPAIRAWARSDAQVAQAVQEVDEKRIAFVAERFTALEMESTIRPRLVYAALVGLQTLPNVSEEEMEASLLLLLSTMLEGSDAALLARDAIK